MSEWLSGHLFMPGGMYEDGYDRALLDTVVPFVRTMADAKWVDRFFFIRYSELGHHLRIRLHGPREILDAQVKPAMESYLSITCPNLTIEEVAPETLAEGRPLHRLRWIPYVPEVDRYGGPDALLIAERVFHASTRAAIGALRGLPPGARGTRLGRGLIATLITTHAFYGTREGCVRLMRKYYHGYLPRMTGRLAENEGTWSRAFTASYERQAATLSTYVEEVYERLALNEPILDFWDEYREALAFERSALEALALEGRVKRGVEPLSWQRCLQQIVPSYIHMMNNRLGVTVPEESYLANMIAQTLSATSATPA
jgi:thiopeptide-type bacteriocin biosynthesis protein